jgi:hypothetical protein
MEFGRVCETALNTIIFSLPAEPAANKLVLNGTEAQNIQVYVGCAKWGRKEWIG